MLPLISYILKVVMIYEQTLVEKLLRSPTFHHGVRKIHRTVEDLRYGRDPNEPLRPGEATEEPDQKKGGFVRYFVEEIRNQARGTPTDPPPPPPPRDARMNRPREATEDPDQSKGGFLRHFLDELRNQARGTPSDAPPPPPRDPRMNK